MRTATKSVNLINQREKTTTTTTTTTTKKQICRCPTLFCTFLCRCFARLQCHCFERLNREISQLHIIFMEVCCMCSPKILLLVFLYTFIFWLSLIFTVHPSYFTLVSLWGRWTGGRTVTWQPQFFGCISNQIFLPMLLRCARFVRTRASVLIGRGDNLKWRILFHYFTFLKCDRGFQVVVKGFLKVW